jgi:hypothetical protein
VQTYFTETYYPAIPFPPELFKEVILVNSLRARDASPETTFAATLLLARIEAFCPETWSATRPPEFQQDWELLSAIFHAATAIFAILSLQSSGALPSASSSRSTAFLSLPQPAPSPSSSSNPSSPSHASPLSRDLDPEQDANDDDEEDDNNKKRHHGPHELTPVLVPATTTTAPTAQLTNPAATRPTDSMPDPTQNHELALELELARARHARTLFALLERGLAAPRARRRMAWPLIVAGVEAARAGDAVQRYVAQSLAALGRETGCAPPLVARRVLEGFWARGQGRAGGTWDECFEEGLALVM